MFCVHWVVLSLSLALHTFNKEKATQQSYCVAHTLRNTHTHTFTKRECARGWVVGSRLPVKKSLLQTHTYTHTPSLRWSSTFAIRCQVCSSSANLSCLMCFLSSEAGDLFSRKAVFTGRCAVIFPTNDAFTIATHPSPQKKGLRFRLSEDLPGIS